MAAQASTVALVSRERSGLPILDPLPRLSAWARSCAVSPPAPSRNPTTRLSSRATPCKACSVCSDMPSPTASASLRSTPGRLRCSAGSVASVCRAGRPISDSSRLASPKPARRSWCRRRPARSGPWWARSPRSRAAARWALPAGPTNAATSPKSWASTHASTTRRATSPPS